MNDEIAEALNKISIEINRYNNLKEIELACHMCKQLRCCNCEISDYINNNVKVNNRLEDTNDKDTNNI